MLNDNILRGERVRLTAVRQDDLVTLARWSEDSAYSRLFDERPAGPKSLADWESWLATRIERHDVYLYAVRPADGDQLLGYMELYDIMWAQQNGWLRIGIDERSNWGLGYGQEATALVITFAFAELNLHRLSLTVFGYNRRLLTLAKKLGFTQEGILREHLYRGGQRHNLTIFGLLRHEWQP